MANPNNPDITLKREAYDFYVEKIKEIIRSLDLVAARVVTAGAFFDTMATVAAFEGTDKVQVKAAICAMFDLYIEKNPIPKAKLDS